ncbi:MAG: hypothetical protein WCT04_22215 [Planctomycetota bacterium]
MFDTVSSYSRQGLIMLHSRHLLAVFVSMIGYAGFCFAADSITSDKPVTPTVPTLAPQKAAVEVPIPVANTHLPDVLMPDEAVADPSSKKTLKLYEPSKPVDAEAKDVKASSPTDVATPVSGKDDVAKAPVAADKPAEKAPAATTTTDYVKSNRADCDDDDLESVYQPPSIEGYGGWKKNKVRREQVQLINNDMIGIPDRWRIGVITDSRHVKGNLWNPYRQNMIKGDYPIIGQSIFMSAGFTSDTLVEGHNVPTPSGVTAQRPGSFKFYGDGDQFILQQNFEISLELFKGETDFKPREWEVRCTPIFNINYADVRENFAVKIDPRKGDKRFDSQVTFNEFFGEYHFADLSPNYDFVAARAGIQSFNADFRGFLFCDNNLGIRTFGNLESNRLQYNLAYFEMLAKDTNSDLNSFDFKDHHVVVANVIRQDTFWKGFNILGNFAFSDEESSREYNSNGVIVKPFPVGDLKPHANKVYYAGLGMDGHIGRLNVNGQFYHAFGTDTHNNLAGKRLTINANMAATELSYDMDWMRFRASAFYASGDKNTVDHKAGGFDSIFDNPNFAGGQFSYWVRQGFGAGNALTSLKQRGSLLPSLNSSKGEGQRNFVNPGLRLLNVGYDAELTQNLKAVLNVNYLEFDNTSSLGELLHQNNLSRKIGYDYSLGMVYRPWLNNQVIINGGVAGLTPNQGFRQLYTAKTLYAGFLGVTVRY